MENPILSIIIPVYNGEKYLEAAVDSVLKQPCRDLEIIIVNDGSQDASGAIADRLAREHSDIRAVHIPNSGVSAARNTGIDHARGEYIGFLDSDDVLCKDAFTADIREHLAAGKYDILSFSHLKGTQGLRGGQLLSAQEGYFSRDDNAYTLQAQKHFCSYLYHRKLLVDGNRFPVGIRYHEDVCWLFLISRNAENIMQFSKPWFVYRMNFSSVMHRLNSPDYILEEIAAWDWCSRQVSGEKDYRDCQGNIFSYMVQYIQYSCGYGIPAEEIMKKVMDCAPFREAMEDFGKFWTHKESVAFYREFTEDPRRLWRKYHCIGIGRRLAGRIIRTGPGNRISNRLRYTLPLKQYLVE